MNELDRRRFLGRTAGAAAALGISGGLRATTAADRLSDGEIVLDRPPSAPMIELGNTKIKMSRLGQGTGVRGKISAIGSDQNGFREARRSNASRVRPWIRFFDLADLYGTTFTSAKPLRNETRGADDPHQNVVAIRRPGGTGELARRRQMAKQRWKDFATS